MPSPDSSLPPPAEPNIIGQGKRHTVEHRLVLRAPLSPPLVHAVAAASPQAPKPSLTLAAPFSSNAPSSRLYTPPPNQCRNLLHPHPPQLQSRRATHTPSPSNSPSSTPICVFSTKSQTTSVPMAVTCNQQPSALPSFHVPCFAVSEAAHLLGCLSCPADKLHRTFSTHSWSIGLTSSILFLTYASSLRPSLL